MQAQDVMMERQGVATRLLYQLYVALQRKQVCWEGRGGEMLMMYIHT